MPSITNTSRAVAVFAGALLVATAAMAEDSRNLEKEARTQYRQGIELYEAGQFEQASVAFERAYELRPSFKILWNLAQAENELGHFAAARIAYSRYLEEGGSEVPADRRKEALAELERLAALVGSLAVEGGKDGASLFVDGRNRGVLPLESPLLLDLGDHEVEIRDEGGEQYREVVRVAGGEMVTLRVADLLEGPKENAAPESPSQAPNPPRKRLWTWVTLGAGVAAGVVGGILGGVALANKSDIEGRCNGTQCLPKDEDAAAQVEGLALCADILFGVAAAGIVTGAVLFFVEGKGKEDRELIVAPAVTPDSASLLAAWRF
ncbi:MAG: PEGA domain-containing protein [Myxococcota bacterium]|jgi:tetratricopeptide (TPR) repeat protein|nr:PEGA domain-containing protein [Myxococcota bacterium]